MAKRFLFYSSIFLFTFSLFSQTDTSVINGLVTDIGQIPISNVNVLVKGTSKGSKTDRDGKYTIIASPKDILVFSYVGLQSLEIVVTQRSKILDVQLLPKVQKLDEVTVKKKRAFTQKELLAEYPTNPNLIKTNWGILDKDRASYSMRIIDGSQILPVGADFLVSLQVHFPNMVVTRNMGEPLVFFTNSGSSGRAIFDVDGFIYQQTPTFIIPDEIDRIAVMTRNGAMMRYGPAGAGGVIIINTKQKTKMDELGVKRTYDNLDLIDSLYSKVTEKQNYELVAPDYLNAFKTVQSEKEALQLFQDQRKRFGDSPYYFLDVSDYFRNEWGNTKQSLKILEDLEERFFDDTAVLKALTYAYDEMGQKDQALALHLKILKIESKMAQSYRDVAQAYLETGNFKRALGYYARYELAINELATAPFEKYGVDLLMTTEAQNILKLRSEELSLKKEDFEDNNLSSESVRLLFEWNQPDADFELQVVAPDKYYDDWHTPEDGSLEKSRGYQSQQFFLDEDFPGEWQINIKYMGNTEDKPTYLKLTTFFDYGRPTQSKKTRVFRLQEKNVDVKLISVFTEEKYIVP